MTNISLFLQLFMGLYLSGAGSQCPITLEPSRVLIKYGESVTVNCTTDSEHEGLSLEVTGNSTGLQMVNHLSWTLNSVMEPNTEPIAELYCSILLKSGESCQKQLDIVYYNVAENFQILSNNSDGAMEEGENYYLKCGVEKFTPAQNISVLWYKDDREYPTEIFNSSLEQLPNASKIHFIPTRKDNGERIRCEAHLDLRSKGLYVNVSSQIFQINVKFPPTLLSSDVDIEEGETLDNKSPIEAHATLKVDWFKNGQKINSSEPLRREDSGFYTANAEGETFNVSVHVVYGPELSCAPFYTAMEHTTNQLNCTIGGYPKPEVALYKDGEEDSEVLGYDDVFGYFLKPTRKDSGNYTLVASTDIHNVTQTFEVFVHYSPSEIFELEDTVFTLGSSVSLKCDARGNPRPLYHWFYYNTSNVFEKQDDGVSIVEIHNATTFNMGSYKCIAKNEHGSVDKTARLSVKDVKQECPLQISPEIMVLEYNGEGASATCEALEPSNTIELYWMDEGGNQTSSNSEWVANTQLWDVRPVCKGDFHGLGRCEKRLDIILYKLPDSVSINIEGGDVPLKENDFYTLVCEITNVAPAKQVDVRWFHGNESFKSQSKVTCDGCNINTTRSVTMLFRTNITVDRKLNGVEFSCEAELNLPGLHLPLNMSTPLNITVHYPPIINTSKLSSTVPVFSGYSEDLKCEADGNPRPEIRWTSNVALQPQHSDGVLTVTEKGIYTCNATNHYGSAYHQVEVIEKVDYLPLIAGFVAVTVVIISIIFLFIFSIYYKNTKMRRYNLKNPKFGIHNHGNVAHNGWDLPLPMTKL